MKRTDPLLPTFLLILSLLLTHGTRGYASPVDDLQKVGSTTLKWMFFTIYDSTLYTDDGEYSSIEPGLALKIDYRRNIKRNRLIDTTRDQWMELNLYDPDVSEYWLAELNSFWPDIRRGDSITLYIESDMTAAFFHNQMPLGQVEDAAFTESFLAIWLAENSSYPDLRRELIGIN